MIADLTPADINVPLYSVTAVYSDGRMIEQIWAADTKDAAVRAHKHQHPDAMKVDGEFVMKLEDYLRG